MKRFFMSSAAIASVAFDEPRKRLEVEYVSGGVYAYIGVTRAEFHDLLRAGSAGEFINRRVKPNHLCVIVRRSPPPLV